MTDKVTVPRIRAMRQRGERVVCITAYDAPWGRIADASGADVVLVGDSVGNVVLGRPNTNNVSLEEMAHHTRAVAATVRRALLVADLPFGSYQSSVPQAVDSAVTLVKAGAEAVKLEGDYHEAVQAIVRAGIPVMGHIGMTPQSHLAFGGFRVQGRGDDASRQLEMATALDEAGAFAIVLELMPVDLAKRISEAIQGLTIGIGAGVHCHGQIQVIHDALGLSEGHFRHAKRFAELGDLATNALREYAEAVRTGEFPGPENSFEK